MDDAELVSLVSAAAGGDEAAWAAIVDQFGDLVWSVARGHCRNAADAADVSQITWLRLVEALPSIRRPERLRAWLATTARRESLRLLRARHSRLALERLERQEGCQAVDDLTPERIVTERQSVAELWQALEVLPLRCRPLMRALLADPVPTYKELSEAFDMPMGTIGPTRTRCLDLLWSYLSTGDIDSSEESNDVKVTSSTRRAS